MTAEGEETMYLSSLVCGLSRGIRDSFQMLHRERERERKYENKNQQRIIYWNNSQLPMDGYLLTLVGATAFLTHAEGENWNR